MKGSNPSEQARLFYIAVCEQARNLTQISPNLVRSFCSEEMFSFLGLVRYFRSHDVHVIVLSRL